MKRKILIGIALSSAFVIIACALLGGLIYKKMFSAQIESGLGRAASLTAEYLEASYPSQNDVGISENDAGHRYGYLSDLSLNGLRITLVAPDGKVLFESDAGAEQVNHADRPEIVSALRVGSGYSERISASLGYKTCYYAVKLSDGTLLRVAGRASELYAFYNRTIPIIAAIGAGMLLITVAVSVMLTKKLVAPIEELGKRIDENDVKAPYPELEPFVEYVRHSRDYAREAEKLRQEFTANVSHELKTPLTSISGYAEMIETGLAKKEDVPNFAQKIHFEALRLLTLIADIIQLSELDSLTGLDDLENVDLLEVSANAESYLSMSAEQNGVSIEVCGEPLIVNGCRSQLEELVYNLCDNAIRYNRSGGSVRIIVSELDGFPAVTVKDTGIGIPEDKTERIFERFYRVDKSRSKKSGGTGLGLAIVKHIAMHHGAEIRVESKLGEGTEISVIFKK